MPPFNAFRSGGAEPDENKQTKQTFRALHRLQQRIFMLQCSCYFSLCRALASLGILGLVVLLLTCFFAAILGSRRCNSWTFACRPWKPHTQNTRKHDTFLKRYTICYYFKHIFLPRFWRLDIWVSVIKVLSAKHCNPWDAGALPSCGELGVQLRAGIEKTH